MLNTIIKYLIPSSLHPIIRRRYLEAMVLATGAFRYCGQRIYTPINSFIFQHIANTGAFEPEILQIIIALTRPGTYAIDVGANIGVMSVPILVSCPEVNVISVECSPSTLPYLRRTYDISPHRNRWKLCEVAIGDKEGSLEFYTSGPASGAHDGLKDTRRVGVTSIVTVPATTLDTLWREHGKPPVSVIKIDIEGSEFEALSGAEELISQFRPYIIFEWNTQNIAAYGRVGVDIFKLVGPGYEIYSLPSLNLLRPSLLPIELSRCEMFLLAPVPYSK